MHQFEVWAPRANKVSVQVDGSLQSMEGPDQRGCWRTSVVEAGPGSFYGFVLDDDPRAYPDPRSQWQPNGVHDLSCVYNHSAFQWHDRRWQAPPLASAIIYEMHVGTFTLEGTFDSAVEKLDFLHALGITHIEIMPVAAYPGDRG